MTTSFDADIASTSEIRVLSHDEIDAVAAGSAATDAAKAAIAIVGAFQAIGLALAYGSTAFFTPSC
jgi:hypothetical protein